MADNPAHWLEASLLVDGELAEAVAGVMSRFASNGVVVETQVTYNDAEDVGTPCGPVRVYGYLLADDQLEDTRRQLEEALWYLGRIQPLPQVEYRSIQDENWMESWKKNYHPIPIGEQLLVLPAWIEQEDPARLAVKIDPSMAFGTGTHPSTQLCLEMVERHTRPGGAVIDVGCGSGILSIAALRLGASHALGVDVDRASIAATRENAVRNGVAGALECGLGSVTEVLEGRFSIREAPLVLANILAPVIVRLFEEGLANLVQPGGVLALAGILEEQARGILEAAEGKGLRLLETRCSGDWVALACNRH